MQSMDDTPDLQHVAIASRTAKSFYLDFSPDEKISWYQGLVFTTFS
jgi:hypothetical protein